jgi:DNA-binding beta-propeller fold protein YncE
MTVRAVSEQGTVLTTIGTGTNPDALAADPAGTLWVASFGDSTVQPVSIPR